MMLDIFASKCVGMRKSFSPLAKSLKCFSTKNRTRFFYSFLVYETGVNVKRAKRLKKDLSKSWVKHISIKSALFVRTTCD